MKNKLLIFALIISSLILQSCNKAHSSSFESKIAAQTPTPKNENISEKKIDFQGVSFAYNPQIFGQVKTEEIADYPLKEETDKPDFVEPRHRLFTFELETDYSPMIIAVYPIDDFPKMYSVNKSSMKSMENEIIDFKKVLKDKNFRDDAKQIPYFPYVDAHQDFQVKVSHFSFSGIKGILFLTFWSTQYELPSNRQLRYIFEGLTDDGKYYVLAEMPTKVKFLLDKESEEYEGYKVPWGKFDDKTEMKRFASVIEKIGQRVDKLPQNEFQPQLNELEKIISTLKIGK